MITRELIDSEVVKAEAETHVDLIAESSSGSRVPPEDAAEFAKFKERRDAYKADFAKFRMYRQRANEMDVSDANHEHAATPNSP